MRRPTPATPSTSAGTSMRRGKWTTALLASLTAIVLAGCSNSGTTATNSLAAAPVAVPFGSSVIRSGKLPALYTCDGKDISPPLSWGTVPSTVEELALFVLGAKTNKSGRAELSVEWGMAGVKPRLHHLRAGEVPPGAFLVANSEGARRYSICPPGGQTARYSFALLALPNGARASPTFPGIALFHNLTLANPQFESPATGAFRASYTRG